MKNKTAITVILLLTIVYNFFFWNEKLGVNLFIFIILLLIFLIIFNTDSLKSRNVFLACTGVIYSGALVVFNNSVLSKFAFITSFIAFTGFVHQRRLRTVFNALFTAFGSFMIFPYNVFEEIRLAKNRYKLFAGILKISRLVALPAVIFFVFYALYAHANPIFNSYSNTFWEYVKNLLDEFLINYPPVRFVYIFFGLFLVTGILFNRNVTMFLCLDLSFLDSLRRDSKNKLVSRAGGDNSVRKLFRKLFKFKMTSLLTEYRIGLILIILVNALLLILNIIDINFIWFGFDSSRVSNLAYFVHEGTYYLIISILLSMAILLYFFRGNINFYRKNHLLKYGAYLWIVQNGTMAVTLLLRNYYYIDYYYALSHKRIGVMIFILLVMIGLISMFEKIRSRKTTFYLFKVNSLAAFAVMILMCTFNWDVNIASFNLKNPDSDAIDAAYLLTLSDDTLPILQENMDILDREIVVSKRCSRLTKNGLDEFFRKKYEFVSRQKQYTLLSWNYADWSTLHKLRQN